MINVSEVYKDFPSEFKSFLHKKTYDALRELNIPFERVENDSAVTMEDCIQIDARLNMKTVKTLLLTNRQETSFYLFVTPGDKMFRTKDFSSAMGISRVSFATPEKLLEILGTEVGAATIFGLLCESARDVQLVFDSQALCEEWYGCTDGTTTGYMKIATKDVLEKLVPYTNHHYTVIDV
ncbi:MAG: prolyl-tRNA synthetase associated domain-containing protein [Clostridia bacterium]|nr:prolyl-tRNA synthetase associated domain-containing protein [Clostridia bacterium]